MGNAQTKLMSASEIIRLLSELKAEVRQRYKAEIKGLFGSYMRGEEKEESDIDVLVEFDEGANLLDFTGLSLFLEEKLNRHVDVVIESTIRQEIKTDIFREIVYI